MATLTAVTTNRTTGALFTGAAPTASTGDVFANTGREVVEVYNGNAGTLTITWDVTGTIDGAVITDPTSTVLTGVRRTFGPFPPSYNNSSDQVKFTCDVQSSVLVQVNKVPSL